jgi:hypothetical protein
VLGAEGYVGLAGILISYTIEEVAPLPALAVVEEAAAVDELAERLAFLAGGHAVVDIIAGSVGE